MLKHLNTSRLGQESEKSLSTAVSRYAVTAPTLNKVSATEVAVTSNSAGTTKHTGTANSVGTSKSASVPKSAGVTKSASTS